MKYKYRADNDRFTDAQMDIWRDNNGLKGTNPSVVWARIRDLVKTHDRGWPHTQRPTIDDCKTLGWRVEKYPVVESEDLEAAAQVAEAVGGKKVGFLARMLGAFFGSR